MKKTELYEFVEVEKNVALALIDTEIDKQKESELEAILENYDLQELYRKYEEYKAYVTEQHKILEDLGLNITPTPWIFSYLSNVTFNTDVSNYTSLRKHLVSSLALSEEVRELRLKRESTHAEYRKLILQLKQLTAKKGYELLLELGYNKTQIDSYGSVKNELVVQNFDTNLLGTNMEN